MNIERGYRNQLSSLCDLTKPIDVSIHINGTAEYDFSFFGLSERNQLEDEAYMIFYNQLESPNKEMILTLQKNNAHLSIDFNKISSKIEKISSTISIDGNGTMGEIHSCSFELLQDGISFLTLSLNGTDFQDEKAIIGFEFYKKTNEWRINAIASGFNGGLKALLESYGGTASNTDSEGSKKQLDSPVSTNKISLEKKLEKTPELIQLAKPVQLALEKRNLQDIKAKVAIVIDISGSMTKRYENGSVQMIIEKTLPLAVQFDDDGQMECWYFGTIFEKRSDITLDNYKNAVPVDWKKLMVRLGGCNNEPLVMKDVMDTFKNTTLPVYVLFISDGGVHKKKEITTLMKEASQYPIFWQFMGVGGSSYGILEKLDSMKGRLVDNADFFAIDDFRTLSNNELYERLLNEFPAWLKKAKELHILS